LMCRISEEAVLSFVSMLQPVDIQQHELMFRISEKAVLSFMFMLQPVNWRYVYIASNIKQFLLLTKH
jgi:hypothetical protein